VQFDIMDARVAGHDELWQPLDSFRLAAAEISQRNQPTIALEHQRAAVGQKLDGCGLRQVGQHALGDNVAVQARQDVATARICSKCGRWQTEHQAEGQGGSAPQKWQMAHRNCPL
jgi:hypothetical protein